MEDFHIDLVLQHSTEKIIHQFKKAWERAFPPSFEKRKQVKEESWISADTWLTLLLLGAIPNHKTSIYVCLQ